MEVVDRRDRFRPVNWAKSHLSSFIDTTDCDGYWRERGEIDFVVLRDGDPVPVQVSWDGPTERHQRALDSFYEAHPRSAEAVFLTAASFDRGLPLLEPDE